MQSSEANGASIQKPPAPARSAMSGASERMGDAATETGDDRAGKKPEEAPAVFDRDLAERGLRADRDPDDPVTP